MSYQVLARKWRPQDFADLIGQEHVSQTLGNAIRTGRVHHAFLFTGARGVGKTSAARILAKALNCEAGLSPEPCNVCPSCVEITAGQGIDVQEIDGASNTGVDDVRELRESLRYLPARGRFKIYIIDEVHMLSINAFNALLKTLEEPPPHAKFILATTEPHKIPITILSRCQRFDFRKIPLSRIIERLRRIVDAEGVQVSDRALALIARRGEGSMRDSLSTLDQVVAFCGEAVVDEEVQTLLGLVDRRLLLDAAEAIMRRDSRLALETVRRVDDQGFALRPFCQELVEVFRSLIVLRVVNDPGALLEVTADELQELQGLAEAATLEDCQRCLTVLLKTEAELAGSAFPRLVLEMAMVRLAHLPPARDVATLVRKLEELERRLGEAEPARAAPSPPARPARPEPPEPRESPPEKKFPAPAPAAEGEKGWPGLVEQLKKRRPPLGYLLEKDGRLLVLDPPRLEIGIPERSFGMVNDADFIAYLEQIAGEYFGMALKLKVVPLNGDRALQPPSLSDEREARESGRRKQLRDETLAHPGVKAALEILGGEIAEIRPFNNEGDPARQK